MYIVSKKHKNIYKITTLKIKGDSFIVPISIIDGSVITNYKARDIGSVVDKAYHSGFYHIMFNLSEVCDFIRGIAEDELGESDPRVEKLINTITTEYKDTFNSYCKRFRKRHLANRKTKVLVRG